MQIKMIGDFSYDLVPGSTRRTLHEGLVLEEASDVATAAIAAGKAMRWPPELAAVVDSPDDGADDEGTGGEPPKPSEPAPAKKPSGKKAAAKSEPTAQPAGEPSPAEAVEPGAGG